MQQTMHAAKTLRSVARHKSAGECPPRNRLADELQAAPPRANHPSRAKDVDGQLVGMWVIHRHELHAGFHQGRHEGEISGQPIQLGDCKPSLVLAAGLDGTR
jgi:hypothetical protein